MRRRGRENPDIVVRDGKPVAVILDIEEYRKMLERLRDTDGLDELRGELTKLGTTRGSDHRRADCQQTDDL